MRFLLEILFENAFINIFHNITLNFESQNWKSDLKVFSVVTYNLWRPTYDQTLHTVFKNNAVIKHLLEVTYK